jgi:para-aminobenzoate synthetase
MSPAFLERTPRILFLDAYDSFSNNIIALVKGTLNVEVISIKIDDKRFHDKNAFVEFLHNFDAVITGPGPGTAENIDDVGLTGELWALSDETVLPALGICLGFQSLALAFGGRIERLKKPHHGIDTQVLHRSRSIFKGLGEIRAIQYHSLCVNIGHPIQSKRAVAFSSQLWKSSDVCPDLEPLAWDFDETENGAVLMGVRHVKKPFWGVQYHPESICTNEEGAKIVQNWWDEAQTWNSQNRRSLTSPWAQKTGNISKQTLDEHLGVRIEKESSDYFGNIASLATSTMTPQDFASLLSKGRANGPRNNLSGKVEVATCGSGRVLVRNLCNVLKVPAGEAIVLESGLSRELKPHQAGTGRHSIIGLFEEGRTLRLHYFVQRRILQLRDGDDKLWLEIFVLDIWTYLKQVMECLKLTTGPSGSSWAPFWGGLMGFATYEACLDTINVEDTSNQRDGQASSRTCSQRPDICFALITRSVVIDHAIKKIYVQSIGGDDHLWVSTTLMQLRQAVESESEVGWLPADYPPELADVAKVVRENHEKHHIRQWASAKVLEHYLAQTITMDMSEEEYHRKIEMCQNAIRAGESYELCLTDQLRIGVPSNIPQGLAFPWHLYQRLMKFNSAPFGAYVRIGKQSTAVSIVSSSPERFLSWDRFGVCQCRPIKGTVKKGGTNPVSRQRAEEILSSSKERAENLMIVDLTRHQLYGVYGAGSVRVKKLMEVEEYETVYQLVSVLEGIPPGISKPSTPEEWDDTPNGFPFTTMPSSIASSTTSSTTSSTPFTQISPPLPPTQAKSGIDVLAASLPPGSMTGAPKKRSCELLQNIEGHKPRGIYSGILGYLDIGGGGDFSVVIRTAYSWDDDIEKAQASLQSELQTTDSDTAPLVATTELSDALESNLGHLNKQDYYSMWHVGAGGAITIQSTPESEWQEMRTKLESVMKMLNVVHIDNRLNKELRKLAEAAQYRGLCD